MVMKSVSVATLKSKLSKYLAAVRKGQEIIVTAHQHPIARLVPLKKSPGSLDLTAATKPVASLKKVTGIKLKFDPVDYLLEDRRRR